MASLGDSITSPDNHHEPSAAAAPDAETASHAETRPRKRRRRTVACTQCRTRKLKCDREYPTCGRCLKGRTPGRCTYEDSFVWQQPKTVTTTSSNSPAAVTDRFSNHITLPPPSSIAAISPPSTASGIFSSRSLALPASEPRPPGQSRRRFLDTVLDAPNPAAANHWRPMSDGDLNGYSRSNNHQDVGDQVLASPSQKLELSNKVILRGKETRTRFNGSGIFANLFLQFPQLKPFMNDLKTNNPTIRRLRFGYENSRMCSTKAKMKQPIPNPDTAMLMALLPPKQVVEELLRLYLAYVEPFHRVIHIPSFRRELSEMWARIDSPDMVSAAFVAQLLLILAAAFAFFEAERSLALSEFNIPRWQVVNWIRYAEKWLEVSDIKRPDLTVLRIHCLAIIARNTQGLRRSRVWLDTGNLVKLAMLAGYHRDPDHISKITLFNKEMRRRIWTTIVELDCQISMDRGMPPSLQASDFDTAPPLNINDDEINENTIEEPRSRPLQEFTDCVFPCVLAQSLPLRLKICSLMNSPVVSCSYEDIRRLEWELGCFQAGLPLWPTPTDQQTNHKVTLARAFLETKLGQWLLAIHTPFAIEANEDPLFESSSRARLEAATLILSRQLKLHETSIRLSFAHLSDSVAQASVSILQHLYASRTGYTSNLLRQVLPVITDSLVDLVEKSIICLENKLMVMAKGAKQFFILNLLFSLVKAELYPDQAELFKKLTIERISAVAQNLIMRDSEVNLPPDGVDLPSISQVPGLASSTIQTPLDSVPGSFEGNSNLPDLLTPPDDFNSLLQVFDWEDLSTFPYSL
ncbi:putative C6 transcription factor [Talaromyces proteolyticus]|uniref:C6 transcription factor n=1 Tax=Talaromyces proteolyticus TaxID=1131652 RepID=A0AAD4KMT5_9EURO|nr:putative C6 transcription factor [Talaromyces proteolyticus]KAH8693920.1 putative C6 transcription factor [Talaromyces proteolyticus]